MMKGGGGEVRAVEAERTGEGKEKTKKSTIDVQNVGIKACCSQGTPRSEKAVKVYQLQQLSEFQTEATAGEVYFQSYSERYVEQQSVKKMKRPSLGHKDLQCQRDALAIAVCGLVPFV